MSKVFIYAYLLTAWCRVLLEQLTGLQLVKKFPAFHGNRRFITALTCVRHLSLSWASPIQSIYPHPTSCRSILILSTHLRLGLPSGLFPSGFPTKTLYTPRSSPIRGLIASVISSQPLRRWNLSPYNPSYLSPTVLNIRWQIKPETYVYEQSVTDASKPKKQIYLNDGLQLLCIRN